MNEKLVIAATAGDKKAFCELYGQYKDRLYRYALYRLGSPEDAEDAVSDCVLRAWKGIPDLKDPAAFGSWIFRILSVCCSERIRKIIGVRENTERLYYEGSAAASEGPGKAIELAEALAILTDKDRDIVLLSVVAGLSSNEIARQKNMTPGTVRSRLSRSLAKMREFLSQGEK